MIELSWEDILVCKKNKNIMKVLCILSSVSPFGGSSKSFLRLVKELTSVYDVEMLVCVPSMGGVCEDLKLLNNVRIEVLNVRFNVYPHCSSIKDCLLFLPKLIWHFIINTLAYLKLKRLAILYKPDIIYTNVGVVNVGYKVAKKLNIPHIYHLREYQDKHFRMNIIPSMQRFKMDLKGKNNYNICITNGIQKHFNLIGYSNSKVIYNPCFSKNSVSFYRNKEKYFLFVGRLDEKKGVYDVLEAFSKFYVKDKDYKLLLAGVPSDGNMDVLLKEAQRLGIETAVDFLGMRNDVFDLMRKATLTIMASDWEGFGLVTAEAMGCGCLVVGKDNTGTKEQFDNGLNFIGEEIALRFQNVDELSDIMVDVTYRGVEFYFPMIENAQKTVVNFYTIEESAKQVYNFYREICQK